MDNRWRKITNNQYKKRYTLHSLGVGFVFFIIAFAITKIFDISLCPINNIFGVSCFGCGMTRAFMAILRLDFTKALAYNVLSVPLFISIVLYSVCALIDVIFDKNCVETIEKQLCKKYMVFICVVFLVVVIILKNR